MYTHMDGRIDLSGPPSFQLKKTHAMRHRAHEISEHTKNKRKSIKVSREKNNDFLCSKIRSIRHHNWNI